MVEAKSTDVLQSSDRKCRERCLTSA